MTDDPGVIKQTAGAQRAMGLAVLVNKVFVSERVKGSAASHPGYRLEMSGPDGPSTTELKKVEDRLQLVPMETTHGEVSILIGSADPGMSQADLYAFDRLRALHAKTSSDELPLDRADYERVLAKIEAFFDRQGVPVTIIPGAVAGASPNAVGDKKAGRMLPWIVVGVVAVGAILAFTMLHR
jgi:hypothetical protein